MRPLRRLPRPAAVGALLAAALLLPRPAAARQACLVVALFDGPGKLGQQVTTVLHLQIWQTLRRAPWPNPARLDFGSGIVMWGESPLKEQSYESAEAFAPSGCQVVLWGSVSRFGGGVVVQAYLSLVGLEPAEERLWIVRAGAERSVALGFPRRRYAFAPVVLRADVVEQFSTADVLATYPRPGAKVPSGRAGDDFRAVRQEGDWARLAGPKERWLYMPRLSAERSEVVDFAGALVRVLRQDHEGAMALLGSVISNPHAPSSLRADALLLRAASAERAGRRGDADAEQAAALAPLSDAVFRYRAAFALAGLLRSRARSGPAGPEARAAERKLEGVLAARVVGSDDPWLVALRGAAASGERGGKPKAGEVPP